MRKYILKHSKKIKNTSDKKIAADLTVTITLEGSAGQMAFNET